MGEHDATELVILRAFWLEAALDLARQQADPADWIGRFMARVQDRIDWLEIADRELRGNEGASYERARSEIEKRSGYLRALLHRDGRTPG